MQIKITNADRPLTFPYRRPVIDPNSHSYIDLKKNPDQLRLIPEIRDWPELEHTLVELNRPGSPFSTIGCEKAILQDPTNGLSGVSGYVQIRLEDLSLAKNPHSYLRLFRAFEERAFAGWPDNDTLVEFEMQPTASDDRDEIYWSFSFWLIVRNYKTVAEACSGWSKALRFFREFLSESRSLYIIT